MPATLREKLTALYNAAREGGNVDTAELVSLEAQVQAEDTIAALAAEGEAVRASEKAERERLANIATAQHTARDLVTTAQADWEKAYAGAVDAIVTLLDATADKGAAAAEAVNILQSAGAPTTADDGAGSVAAFPATSGHKIVSVDGKQFTASGDLGEPLRCAIHSAVADPRFRDHTGAPKRFTLYGGTDVAMQIGQADWTAAPAEHRPDWAR